LRSEDLESAPDVVVEEDLAELLAVGEALEAEVLRRLAMIDRRRSYEREGFLSTVSWLVAKFRMSRYRAAELVRLGRAMAEMPVVRGAFAAGELSASAVRLLAEARQSNPGIFPESEAILTDAARSLSIPQLQQAVAYWKQAADTRNGGLGDEDLLERRRLHVSRTILGLVRVDGDLEPETGESLITALGAAVDADARSGPDGDSRTP